MSGAQADEQEPRCYGHVFDPQHQRGSHAMDADGQPAHTWSRGEGGACRHCPELVVTGDRYVCVPGGVIHARCVSALDADVMGGKA